MLRIIHLSDFHLNEHNLRDWKNYVRKPIIKLLLELSNKQPINIIVCTGDLIDKAGNNYKNSKEAFDLFRNEVILPIINELNLTINQFLIVPGNHDINRNKDEERIELGNIEFFKKKYDNIAKYMIERMEKNDFSGMKRIRNYKKFEKSLYTETDNNIRLSIFGSSFKFLFDSQNVGVCCLNSSWRSYSDEDEGNLLIGEEQLINNFTFISDCSVKIALMHHPLDWLSPIERGTITSHINKDFDLLLIGHIHENMTSVKTGFTNTLFTNVAPSGINDIRSDSRTFANGFTVIDFIKERKEIICEYLRYNHSKKEFVLNTDYADNGRFLATIPDKRSSEKIDLVNKLLTNIKEDHFNEMDDHLILHKADKLQYQTIKETFVLPPIEQVNSTHEEEKLISITEITKSKSNLMFFGGQESGKTTLLFRLIREFVDEYDYLGKIPVYIDFDSQGNKDIETSIKEYLRCSSKDVEYLLKENLLVLLYDNLNYNKCNIDQVNKLHRFIEKDVNKDFKIIATSENEISGIIPTDYFKLCIIPFKNYFIKTLKAKEIKSLMKYWVPEEDEIKSDERLEKMVANFCSYSLPSTAMSVCLYMWSLENRDRKPINHAVLLEIYIELLLEKLSEDNIYRDKFDFTNKIQLLAKIAEEMLVSDQPNYSILFSDYNRIIEDYLTNLVGFDFDADTIGRYFLDRRIFVKQKSNRVKFAYSCYFHFFIAKRMEYNPEFRKYIMGEERYYKFFREIDYYTALTRSDKAIFETIYNRFQHRFEKTEFILGKFDVDKYFTPYFKDKPKESIAKDIEINIIKENRPTEEMIEEYHNRRLQTINDPSVIIKKEGSISLDILLVIMSNVLRNSEGVENRELKKKVYDALVKYNIIYMILYKESLIDYVIKHKKLPPIIPSEISLENLLNNIPYYVQRAMYNHLGTSKLSPIILEKIKEDKQGKSFTNSDVEAFLSVALYSDIQGKEFPKYFKLLVKRLKNNSVRNYSLFKLIEYYYRRTRIGSPNEEIYLDILAELKIRSHNLPRRYKEKVIKSLKDGKKAFLNTYR